MIRTSPFSGLTANWMFDPPVSTPTLRIQALAMSRKFWYSRSVSVWAGATVIESPVWTPIGSKFSIEQMMTTLSFRSRMTSSSYSFQPRIDSSTRICELGDAARPLRTISSNSSGLICRAAAGSAEREAGPDDGGVTYVPNDSRGLFPRVSKTASWRRNADLVHRPFEKLAVLADLDRIDVRTDHLDAEFVENALLVKLDRQIQAGLAPDGRQAVRRGVLFR